MNSECQRVFERVKTYGVFKATTTVEQKTTHTRRTACRKWPYRLFLGFISIQEGGKGGRD